jgi:DNA-binding CsgD family transcriptional regulator
MKIFISWSGEDSKQIALHLKVWLKKLLQASEPWMSDVDIQPGTRWSDRIAVELAASDFGIICVTPQNRSAEWIHFEAGALSMAMKDNDRKVVPLLIGFEERGELQRSPLGLFNAVRFTEEDMWKLILTLNAELPDSLDGNYLRELFEMYWPRFMAEIEEVKNAEEAPLIPPTKSQAEVMDQILETVLDIQHRQLQQKVHFSPPIPTRENPEYADYIVDLAKPWFSRSEDRPEDRPLTAREREIVKHIQEGMSNREIADLLSVSIRTVEGHLYQIFAKLGVSDRAALIKLDPSEIHKAYTRRQPDSD